MTCTRSSPAAAQLGDGRVHLRVLDDVQEQFADILEEQSAEFAGGGAILRVDPFLRSWQEGGLGLLIRGQDLAGSWPCDPAWSVSPATGVSCMQSFFAVVMPPILWRVILKKLQEGRSRSR